MSTSPLPSARDAVPTHCPYCAMQCGMALEVDQAGRTHVRECDFPVNRGGLCQKGWTAAELLDHPERLTSPLMRDRAGGSLRRVGWGAALERVAGGVGRWPGGDGRGAGGGFCGGGVAHE